MSAGTKRAADARWKKIVRLATKERLRRREIFRAAPMGSKSGTMKVPKGLRRTTKNGVKKPRNLYANRTWDNLCEKKRGLIRSWGFQRNGRSVESAEGQDLCCILNQVNRLAGCGSVFVHTNLRRRQ